MKDRVGGIDGVHYAPGFTLVKFKDIAKKTVAFY